MPLDLARFIELRYVARMLNDSACMREPVSVCTSAVRGPRYVITGLSKERRSCAEEFCWHGAHMIPRLIREHSVQSLVEIGVCTGMSTVNVLAQFPTTLRKYYLVDPWGGTKCKPGCACAAHMNKIAKLWPDVVRPLKGYSVQMARRIPNASLDLVYVDAAHDYRNARNDVFAYWPKLKPNGVMAGHDFAHCKTLPNAAPSTH